VTAIVPVEFSRTITPKRQQRCGNRVQIEDEDAQPIEMGNPFPVVLVGGDPEQPLLIDEITGALVQIPTVHHQVHEGETFRVWLITPHGSLIPNDGFVDLVLTVGVTRWPHIVFFIGFGGDCEFNLYRSPNFNLDGTLQVPYNMKDQATADVSTLTARWNPTVNAVGTEILGEFFAGGTGGNSSGGAIRRDTEDIWRLGTSYLVRITNRAGNAKQFSLLAQWYEEEDN
jgi:hypothetical protein